MKSISIVLLSSTAILTIFCVLIINRFCVTSCRKQDALKRSGFAFSFILISTILNAVHYVSTIYPNYIIVPDIEVMDVRNGIEIITALLGSHLYRIFLKELYDRLYGPMRAQYRKPCCIRYTPMFTQLLVSIAAIVCYTCNYVLDEVHFLYFFYIFIDIVIVFILFIFLYIWCKVSNYSIIISDSPENNIDNREVQKLKKLVNGVLIMVFILGITDLIVVFIAFDFMYDFTPWSYNEILMGNIVYSTFLIMLNLPLVIWGHRRSKCCVIAQDSVCAKCECQACCKVEESGHHGASYNSMSLVTSSEKANTRGTSTSSYSNSTNISH